MTDATSIVAIDVDEKHRIVEQATRSVKWAGLGSLVPRLITPMSTLVLAALLTPHDFGIVAASQAVINFAQIVVELGIGKAIIQRRDQILESASTAFLLKMVLALVLCGLLWVFAPTLAQAYNLPELIGPLRLSSLALILAGLTGIPNALLTREMLFRRLFWVTAVSQIVSAVTSVILAIFRPDYWALLIGYLAGQTVYTALIWLICDWRPTFLFNWKLMKSILMFSGWIVMSSFLTWLFLYADNLLAGYFLGTEDLGVYALGFNLANILPGMVVSTLSVVAYPAFSALQKDAEDVGNNLLKLQALVATLLFPLCFGLSAVGPLGVRLLYGTRWSGLPMVLLFLSIMPGLSHLWSLNADAFRAIGKPDLWTKAAALTLIILLPLLVLGGKMGLRGFVIARFTGAFLLPIMNIVFAKRYLDLPFARQWTAWRGPLISAGLMYGWVAVLATWLNRLSWMPDWVRLGVLVMLGAGCYFALLRVTAPFLWDNLLSAIFRVLGITRMEKKSCHI